MINPANPTCGASGTHVFVHGLDRQVPPGTTKTPSVPKDSDRCQCGKFTYSQVKTGLPPVVVQ